MAKAPTEPGDAFITRRALVGQNIERAMTDAGKKIGDVMAALDVSDTTVRNWMGGQALPKHEHMVQLGEVLGVAPAWLMEPLYGSVEKTNKARALKALDRLAEDLGLRRD